MSEHRWRKRFKEEMDGVLFQEIRFDEKLKDRIREQIRAEESANGLKIRGGEADAGEGGGLLRDREDGMREADMAPRRIMTGAMRRRMAGVAIAASLLVASVVTFSGILDDGGDPYLATVESSGFGDDGIGSMPIVDSTLPEAAETYEVYDTGVEGNVNIDSVLGGSDTPGVLQAGPDDDGVGGMDVNGVTTGGIELVDLDEARIMFGEDLLLPGYVPEGYVADRIYVTGSRGDEGEPQLFEVRYASTAGSFTLIQQRTGPDMQLTGQQDAPAERGERIEWEGASGFLTAGDSGIELRWQTESLDIVLFGSLERDELIRIAESLS